MAGGEVSLTNSLYVTLKKQVRALSPGAATAAAASGRTKPCAEADRPEPGESSPCVMLAGQVICGGSLSVTVTRKLHVAVRPAASVTVNSLVVMPTGNADPLASPIVCAVIAPGQLSVPTGVA